MRLQVTYWNNSCETGDKTTDIDVDFEKHNDSDFVPYGEFNVERKYSEYDVYVYGDIPEEIKEVIKERFDEGKKFYHGVTENFTFEAE